MPRYFFHVTDGQLYRDNIGTELASPEDARREARATFGDLIRNRDEWTANEWQVDIPDAEGRTLLTLKVVFEEVQGEGVEGAAVSGIKG